MTLVQLHYFKTICKYNNLTRAAKALHISQPTLTHVIHDLEQEFGITLFLRQNKGLVLTKQGQDFLNEANLLLEQADAFSNRMKFLGHTHQAVQFGLSPASSTLYFPLIAQALYQQYPQIQTILVENGSMLNRQKIIDGKLDLAIISSNTPIPSTLGSYKIANTRVCLFVHKEHPLAKKNMLSIQEIKEQPLVMLSEESFLTTATISQCMHYKIDPNIILTTNQISIIKQLVTNKIAATLLFEHTLPDDQEYVSIPVTEFQAIQIYLIWNQYKQMTPAMQHLIEITRQVYPNN